MGEPHAEAELHLRRQRERRGEGARRDVLEDGEVELSCLKSTSSVWSSVGVATNWSGSLFPHSANLISPR